MVSTVRRIKTAKQTAGRDNLGEFAPKFAQLNDDVLFGEVWSRQDQLSARDRSMITISALISGGNFQKLKAHLQMGQKKWVNTSRSVRNDYTFSFLCWLAKSLVSIYNC